MGQRSDLPQVDRRPTHPVGPAVNIYSEARAPLTQRGATRIACHRVPIQSVAAIHRCAAGHRGRVFAFGARCPHFRALLPCVLPSFKGQLPFRVRRIRMGSCCGRWGRRDFHDQQRQTLSVPASICSATRGTARGGRRLLRLSPRDCDMVDRQPARCARWTRRCEGGSPDRAALPDVPLNGFLQRRGSYLRWGGDD